MSSTVTKELSEKDKEALIQLLSDDDPSAIRLLEEAFVARGEACLSLLSRVIGEGSPTARNNAKTILRTIRRNTAIQRFSEFCIHGTDLETGTFMLAETRYPNLKRERYAQQS